MQGTIFRMDRTGHGFAAEWDRDLASRARAQAIFDEEVAKPGQAIADLTNGHDGVFVKAFDPDHQTELLIVPALISG